jgi:hypothetical protein
VEGRAAVDLDLGGAQVCGQYEVDDVGGRATRERPDEGQEAVEVGRRRGRGVGPEQRLDQIAGRAVAADEVQSGIARRGVDGLRGGWVRVQRLEELVFGNRAALREEGEERSHCDGCGSIVSGLCKERDAESGHRRGADGLFFARLALKLPRQSGEARATVLSTRTSWFLIAANCNLVFRDSWAFFRLSTRASQIFSSLQLQLRGLYFKMLRSFFRPVCRSLCGQVAVQSGTVLRRPAKSSSTRPVGSSGIRTKALTNYPETSFDCGEKFTPQTGPRKSRWTARGTPTHLLSLVTRPNSLATAPGPSPNYPTTRNTSEKHPPKPRRATANDPHT